MNDLSEAQSERGSKRWNIKPTIKEKVEYDIVSSLLGIQSKTLRHKVKSSGNHSLEEYVKNNYEIVKKRL